MVAIRSGMRDIHRSVWPPFTILLLTVTLLVPTLIFSFLAAGPGVLPGDVPATLFLQTHVPARAMGIVEFVNWLGTTEVAAAGTAAIGLLLLILRQPAAAALVLATFPMRIVNTVLKVIFGSSRPTEVFVSVTEFSGGYGFPSGHVMGATLLYGMLFILAPRITGSPVLRFALQAVAVVMMILTGVSRTVVGAHWPSDVIGGYLWGVIVLLCGYLTVQSGLRRLPVIAWFWEKYRR